MKDQLKNLTTWPWRDRVGMLVALFVRRPAGAIRARLLFWRLSLLSLGLKAWEARFIASHCRDYHQALKMAAEHIIRNAAARGQDVTGYKQKFEALGVIVEV